MHGNDLPETSNFPPQKHDPRALRVAGASRGAEHKHAQRDGDTTHKSCECCTGLCPRRLSTRGTDQQRAMLECRRGRALPLLPSPVVIFLLSEGNSRLAKRGWVQGESPCPWLLLPTTLLPHPSLPLPSFHCLPSSMTRAKRTAYPVRIFLIPEQFLLP